MGGEHDQPEIIRLPDHPTATWVARFVHVEVGAFVPT